jgi:hypothetical protein
MAKNARDVIDAWRRAEQQAREAEALFDAAFAEYTHQRGPEVAPELVQLVAQSRRRANALLTEALTLLKSQVR